MLTQQHHVLIILLCQGCQQQLLQIITAELLHCGVAKHRLQVLVGQFGKPAEVQ
jgi:hypothetical protein